MKKMYKGNVVMQYEINGNAVHCIIGETEFNYDTAQWIAVKATLTASGFKEAVEKETRKSAPKKTWEEHLNESFGDKEARKHFVEVRNRIAVTAINYFRQKYVESGATLSKEDYKKAEKKFVNSWANRVIAAEAC